MPNQKLERKTFWKEFLKRIDLIFFGGLSKNDFEIFGAELSHNLAAYTTWRTEIFHDSVMSAHNRNGIEIFYAFTHSLEECRTLCAIRWAVRRILDVATAINFPIF